MRKRLSLPDPGYRGRFAPSPTGPLHFGSLVAAIGSYLDAKHHHGIWLVRMEDLDVPRCAAGAADDILRTLAAFGMHSDEAVLYQSRRTAAYEDALRKLQSCGAAYPCCCTRKEIADSALNGIEGHVYPGTCRNGIPSGREERAWRVRTDNQAIEFDDALQGHITQHLELDIGDFVVKRADGLFAYQLAVVADDAFQNITHIVRGADLLASTPRQIHLQRLLGLPEPRYMHLPVAVNEAGEKLSKQTLAAPVDASAPLATMLQVLEFLQQQPPAELSRTDVSTALEWAILNWDASRLRGIRTLPL
ncbi:tRNA glutamyl-Q(34) synthetase GluQRS [Sideroxydans lithotrophicus]|uniref:Glutamyl-Q tRNA(Asp) synthetase n=1 Tax=Sideroxydans lithotrophicus (strain ES-1) TaxID=580332 RepID=D5CQ38_SIDLE|nr:tRNA glutamyl-Q(34) synthetase GluQRS [Sideroxydans lithotrophicus]ADE11202.1 Glutamate--tRNA ligase [Sideroxydans lithotrophicus ES-1]